MSFELQKPYTEEQYANFVVLHNHQNNRNVVETANSVFALEVNEIIDTETQKPIINPNYEQEEQERQKQIEKRTLLQELEDLDKKRIRAICEPSMKDEKQSWLGYYNQQISEKRKRLADL